MIDAILVPIALVVGYMLASLLSIVTARRHHIQSRREAYYWIPKSVRGDEIHQGVFSKEAQQISGPPSDYRVCVAESISFNDEWLEKELKRKHYPEDWLRDHHALHIKAIWGEIMPDEAIINRVMSEIKKLSKGTA